MSEVVDARGLACPLPVIRLAAAARDLPDGALVTVLWTDPAAAHGTGNGDGERAEADDSAEKDA